MQLAIGPHLVSGSWDENSPETSRHTGRNLRRGTLTFSLSESSADVIRKILTDARYEVTKPVFIGDGGTRWHVDTFQTGYTVGGPESFEVDLVEAEELVCTLLEIADFKFIPRHYGEEFTDEALLAHFEVDLDADANSTFQAFVAEKRSAGEYFPVRRIGVNPDTISMRFGLVVWQQLENGARRHLVFLVSEEGDDERWSSGNANDALIDRLGRRALNTDTKVELLIDALIAAGAISAETAQTLRSDSESAYKSRRLELREVENVEEFRG